MIGNEKSARLFFMRMQTFAELGALFAKPGCRLLRCAEKARLGATAAHLAYAAQYDVDKHCRLRADAHDCRGADGFVGAVKLRQCLACFWRKPPVADNGDAKQRIAMSILNAKAFFKNSGELVARDVAANVPVDGVVLDKELLRSYCLPVSHRVFCLR